jgi:hypothetical protein
MPLQQLSNSSIRNSFVDKTPPTNPGFFCCATLRGAASAGTIRRQRYNEHRKGAGMKRAGSIA